MKRLPYVLVCLLLFLTFDGAAQDILSELKKIAIIDQKLMMPMGDGVRLSTDIYRPKTDEPVPVIFVRTPYNFNAYRNGEPNTRSYASAYAAVSRGYAYVIQNERGRYFSEGNWDILGVPLTDGYDAFSWLSDQEWCNGKIGTQGCSSTAEWQMAVAALDHPSHAAMVPMGFGAGVGRIGDYYEQGNWYRGGAHQLLFTKWLYDTQHDEARPRPPEGLEQEDLLRIQRFYDLDPGMPEVDWSKAFWHLPLNDIFNYVGGAESVWQDMVSRKPNDPEWYEGGLYHDDMPFGVPSFWFISWYDVASSPNISMVNHLRENIEEREVADNQFMVISPSPHCGFWRDSENMVIGERYIGDARMNYDSLIYGWFDYWLKGVDNEFTGNLPYVHYYTMGLNKWQTADKWPPENTGMLTYYLNSKGQANSLNGDGVLSTDEPGRKDYPDTYKYDPYNPVRSYGGNFCCYGNAIDVGSFDQRVMEMRNDILVYTSDVLDEGMEVSGFIETVLYVSSDAKDTDFTVKLIDVYPDGRAFNLDETIQRARYREGYDREVFMVPGEVYRLELTPMSTSNYFAAGHRIRIEISSSNFPRFGRNLNTGGNNYDESEGVTATNSIHHSNEYPSSVTLPVVNEHR
ncbi:MAG: CocE/NonD family hydrolase [Bacteroidales bacterium]|jgi:putative CocE/NonD family hydrolase|nr:CocE/NonD family hydrolase [Bacteroidales bacterium]